MRWFRKKKHKSYSHAKKKNEYVEQLTLKSLESAEKGEITSIPYCYQIFAYNEPTLQHKCAQTLNTIIRKMNVSQLKKLDSIYRTKTSMEWFIDWGKVKVDPNIPKMTKDEKITVLGLGTFNPNGYFRERCLKKLLKYNDLRAIGFICLRLRDWVFEVRSTANEYLLDIIHRENEQELLSLIPYLNIIKQSSLNEPTRIINLLSQTLLKRPEILKEGLKNENVLTKRFCYKVFLQDTNDAEYLFEMAEKEKDIISKRLILKKILKEHCSENLIKWLPYLLKNRMSEIRRLAMNALFELRPNNTVELLETMLTDKSKAVREEARYLLNKIKKYDFRQFYIDNLESIGSIYGLGETGLKEDALLLLPFASSNESQKVVGAIKAISNITDDEYIELFINNLASSSRAVSKHASRILKQKYYSMQIQKIHQIFLVEESFYIRKNCASLLTSLSKWDAIPYILEICSDKDKNISLFGENAYLKWVVRFNRSFRAPAALQLTNLQEAIDEYRENIRKETINYLEFLLSEYDSEI